MFYGSCYSFIVQHFSQMFLNVLYKYIWTGLVKKQKLVSVICFSFFTLDFTDENVFCVDKVQSVVLLLVV